MVRECIRKLTKRKLTKRKLIRYYFINIYIIYQNRAIMLMKFVFSISVSLNFMIFLSIFTYGFNPISFLIYNFPLFLFHSVFFLFFLSIFIYTFWSKLIASNIFPRETLFFEITVSYNYKNEFFSHIVILFSILNKPLFFIFW